MKTLLWLLLALPLVLAGGAVLAWVFVTGEMLKPYAEDAAAGALGQPVRIGSLTLTKDWNFSVEAADIQVANAEWGQAERMAEIGRATVTVRLMSLLEEQIDLLNVDVSEAKVALEVDADGRSNWSVDDDVVEAAAPEERSEFPIVRDFRMTGFELTYRDQLRDQRHTVIISDAEGTASAAEGVALTGSGRVNEQPLDIDFSGGSFELLVDGNAPYPIDLTIASQTDVSLQGTIAEPAAFDGADLKLRLAGPDLAVLGILLGLPLPSTPPYSIEGQLAAKGSAVTLRDFAGTIGDSDARGTVTVDATGEVSKLTGELRSKNLDFDDLAGLIGAEPDPTETANEAQKAEADTDGLIPNTPVPTAQLRTAEIDLTFEADKVSSPVAQVESIAAHVHLQDSRLLVRPLTLGVAGGTVSGEIALNVREDVPSADIDLALDDVAIKPFFEGSQFVQEMGGRVSGDLYFLGTGKTLDAMVRSARGNSHFVMRDGMISGLLVEAAGLDVTEALVLAVGDDAKIPMRCAVAAIVADEGIISIKRGAIDTADSLLIAEGRIDLETEQMSLQIEARAKDFSLIDLAAPVVISGTFSDPGIAVGGIDPLPFFEVGDQKDVNCSVLIANAREVAPGKPQ